MGTIVSENFFRVLGIRPMLGRGFAAEEGRVPGRDAVVVLGYDFWKNALGSDASILNRPVVINGIDFTVIGVLPESFTGLDQFFRPTFYLPIAMWQRLASGGDNPVEDREARSLDVRGRLKAGISREAAETEMTALWAVLQRQYPDANRNRLMTVRTEFQQRVRRSPPNAIIATLMTTLAAVVLIIACANVANLLLGRARSRSREVAIRLALGVSRVRLLRQFLTESLLLALLGGVFGIVLAYAGIRFMAASAQAIVPTDVPVVISPQLDNRVLLFSLLAAVVSALLFGLAPAWQSLKTELVAGLKSSDFGDTARRRRTLGRNALVVAQIALSMVLLVAAGMLQAGFRKTLAEDPGFRTDHFITMSLDTSFARYTPAQTHEFYRRLVEQARALPGVESAALADSIPLNRNVASRMTVVPEGYQFPQGQDSTPVSAAVVDEQYFETVRTPIVRGRGFTAADGGTSRAVTMVNEAFAATYWPNQDPIGKRVRLKNRDDRWLEVVGITKTEKYFRVIEPPTPFLYLPFAQNEKPQMSVLVATINADASPLATPLRSLVRDLDVNQPVFSLRTFSSFYRQQAMGAPLLVLRVGTAMGILGLTLALVGLYGLVSYSVARRTREIGVRIAIGAGTANVLRMVLGEGLKLALSGILIGGIATIAVARLLSMGMAGIGAATPAIYVVVPLLLIALTLAASYVPAHRASRVDPLRALRYE